RLVMVSPVSGIYAKVRQKFHLSPLFKFPEPALLAARPAFASRVDPARHPAETRLPCRPTA
ncbi:hypothetical protein, partial [Sinorhizobium meliloti]|uniref:hypothetical protein n=1 Tax=Rhizobium meliloti TaxID=382 RepID=UPI001AECA951